MAKATVSKSTEVHLVLLPSGRFVDGGVDAVAYLRRVRQYEEQDICTSDAQGIVDAEILNELRARGIT